MTDVKIKVSISNRQKRVEIPVGTRLLVRRTCHAVLVRQKLGGSFEVSVTFVDNEQIRKYNNEFRNIDKATDVLSFPLGEDGVYDVNPETGAKMLGDIVISLERAESQAEEYGHSFSREVGYLTAHSMLHLLGYDHVNGGLEAVRMRECEEDVMKMLGLER